jgi:bifunctional DNA-binding transcriptional regulator/antitoxin component of YhaV-PrlF toxin-antitoxin module
MSSPSSALVKVDRQGRLVLPLGFREDLTTTPGEVVLTQTDEGVLISAVPSQGAVSTGKDGLPVLRLGRTVSNAQVVAAVDAERGAR